MRNVIPAEANLIPESAKMVFQGIIFDVYQWQQEMFDGSTQTFEMLKRPDTVCVIAIKKDKIVIVRQKQPNFDDYYFDLPCGRHDVEQESELEATQRELLEETGMSFASWKLLQVTQPLTKIEHFVYLFLATDFQNQVDQKLDPGEKIEVLPMNLSEVKQLIKNPKARHLPKDIFDQVDSLDELAALPEYGSKK